jgi:hypothetical protein
MLDHALDPALDRLAKEVVSTLKTMPAERRSINARQFFAQVERRLEDIETEQQVLNMIGEGSPNSQGLY